MKYRIKNAIKDKAHANLSNLLCYQPMQQLPLNMQYPQAVLNLQAPLQTLPILCDISCDSQDNIVHNQIIVQF